MKTMSPFLQIVGVLLVLCICLANGACGNRSGLPGLTNGGAPAAEQIAAPMKIRAPAPVDPAEQPPPHDREQYELLEENPFQLAAQEPLSTFSVDVDTAGYANLRRMLNNNQKPPVDAVRIEELVKL